MKHLVIAMLLTVVQAPSPVPWKAPDRPARTSQNVKSQTDSHKEQSAGPQAPLNTAATPTDKNDGKAKAQENTRNSVQVSEFLSVSVNRDWADWGNWVFSLLLVIVGGLQVWLLYGTLRTIDKQAGIMERQTGILKDSVAAAQKSVEFAEKEMVLLNRAYLTTEAWGYRFDGKGNVTILFYILNPSGTAARIERIDTETRDIKDAQTCGFMLTPKERYKFSLVPKKYQPGDVFMISGRITYTDIFHRKRHRRFAQMCHCTDTQGVGFSEPEGRGLNDEEEWDNQDSPN